MPYQLIRDDVSHDTIEALEQLLASARQGQAIGLIFGVMMKRRRYIVNSAGEARNDPTFALGMCSVLGSELRLMINQDAGPATV